MGLLICLLGCLFPEPFQRGEGNERENGTEGPGQNCGEHDISKPRSLWGIHFSFGKGGWLWELTSHPKTTCSSCAVELVNHWTPCLLRAWSTRAEWVSCLEGSMARQPGSELPLSASGRRGKTFSIICSTFQTYLQRLMRLKCQTAHVSRSLLALTFGASNFQGTSRSKYRVVSMRHLLLRLSCAFEGFTCFFRVWGPRVSLQLRMRGGGLIWEGGLVLKFAHLWCQLPRTGLCANVALVSLLACLPGCTLCWNKRIVLSRRTDKIENGST